MRRAADGEGPEATISAANPDAHPHEDHDHVLGWSRFLRALVGPNALQSRDALIANRRFLTVSCAAMLVIIGLPACVAYAAACAWAVAVFAALVPMTSAAALVAMRRGVAPERTVGFIVGSLLLAFAGVLAGSRGLHSPAAACCLLIPLAGTMLGGTRSAVIWTAAGAGLLVTLYAAHQLVHIEGWLMVPLSVAASIELALAMAMTTILLTGGASYAQEAMHIAATQEAQRQRGRAERADQLKSEFLRRVSHELKTPLNGILGPADLLLDEETDDEKIEGLTTICSAGERLLELIEDLLQFTELVDGQGALNNNPFNPIALTESIVERYRDRAQGRELAIDLDVAGLEPRVTGDAALVRKCLRVLVDNAVKFSGQGTVQVRVTRQASRVRWTVIDPGPGIAKADLSSVFAVFHQVDGTSTRAAGGTGLGLALLVAMMDLAGGEYGVDSTLGRGSTFWFELDLPPVALQTAQTANAA